MENGKEIRGVNPEKMIVNELPPFLHRGFGMKEAGRHFLFLRSHRTNASQ